MSTTDVLEPAPSASIDLLVSTARLSNAFRWLWGGQSVSLVGSQLNALSFQIIAVSILHANAMQMGILTAAQTLPYLLFGLFVGVLVDRSHKRWLLIGSDLARLVVLISTGVLAGTGHLPIQAMWVVVCVISSCNLIFDATLGAYIPELLDRRHWFIANSRLSLTVSASEVAGPAAAGYILQLISAGAVMFLDGASYLVSAGCILVSRPRRQEQRQEQPSANPSPQTAAFMHRRSADLIVAVKEGVIFVATHPILRIFALWSAVWNFSWSAVLAVFVLYETRTVGMSSGAIGDILAIGGLGGMAGAGLAGRFARLWSSGTVLVTAPLVAACGGAFLLVVSHRFAMAITALSLFLFNLGQSAFGVDMQTSRQRVTPATLVGRMDTTMRLCFTGMASLGALAGGFLASRFGAYATLSFGITGLFIACLGLKTSGLSERIRHTEAQLRIGLQPSPRSAY